MRETFWEDTILNYFIISSLQQVDIVVVIYRVAPFLYPFTVGYSQIIQVLLRVNGQYVRFNIWSLA
jgi:hypothetical protein